MIRYGGLYARHRKTDSSLSHAIPKQKHRIYRSFNQWRTAILISFGYDPLECPACGHKMELLELYYNHRRISLEELYERAMSKSPGRIPLLDFLWYNLPMERKDRIEQQYRGITQKISG